MCPGKPFTALLHPSLDAFLATCTKGWRDAETVTAGVLYEHRLSRSALELDDSSSCPDRMLS